MFLRLFFAFALIASPSAADEKKYLDAAEVKSLVLGKTLVGPHRGGILFNEFKDDEIFCIRLYNPDGNCWAVGKYYFDDNAVCIVSDRFGEFCWAIEEITTNTYRREMTAIKSGDRYEVGYQSYFFVQVR